MVPCLTPMDESRERRRSADHPLSILYASHSETSVTSVKRKVSFVSCLTCRSESTELWSVGVTWISLPPPV